MGCVPAGRGDLWVPMGQTDPEQGHVRQPDHLLLPPTDRSAEVQDEEEMHTAQERRRKEEERPGLEEGEEKTADAASGGHGSLSQSDDSRRLPSAQARSAADHGVAVGARHQSHHNRRPQTAPTVTIREKAGSTISAFQMRADFDFSQSDNTRHHPYEQRDFCTKCLAS